MSKRRTIVVDKNGNPISHLAEVQHGAITWTRSAPASWSIAMSANSEDSEKFLVDSPIPFGTNRAYISPPENNTKWTQGYDPFTEVQLWRGGKLLTWGPSHTVDMNSDTVSVSGEDASYYLQRRFVGPATSLNLLENGDLKTGGNGWYTAVFRGWGNPIGGNREDSKVERTRLPSDPRKWAWRIEDTTPLYGALDNDLSLDDPNNVEFIRRGLAYMSGGAIGNPPTGDQFANAVIDIYVNRNWPSGSGITSTEDSRAFIVGMAALGYGIYSPGGVVPNATWVLAGANWAALSNRPKEELDIIQYGILTGTNWGEYGISNQTEANAYGRGIELATSALYVTAPNSTADAILGELGALPPPEIDFAPTYPTAQTFFSINPQQVLTRITFSCWIEVERLDSPGDGDQSIFIGLFPQNATNLKELIDVRFSSFDRDHPVGQRVRHEVTIDIPAGEFVWGVASVRTCKGISYAYDFQLEWDGGLISVKEDKAEIQRRLVEHLSGEPNVKWLPSIIHPLYPWHGGLYNKSDVNVGHSIANTGYDLTRIYKFGEGGSGLDLLTDLAEDDDTSGWKMVNGPESRIYTTMRNLGVAWQFPMRSTHAGGNLVSFSWQYIGQQAANVVTVQSSYPDSRLQGYATSPTFFANGLTVEDSLSAPEDLGEDLVQPYAETHLSGALRAISLTVRLNADPYFDMGIDIGLLVPVTIYHKSIQVVGLYRIQSMTLTPDDYLELTLTPGVEDIPLT